MLPSVTMTSSYSIVFSPCHKWRNNNLFGNVIVNVYSLQLEDLSCYKIAVMPNTSDSFRCDGGGGGVIVVSAQQFFYIYMYVYETKYFLLQILFPQRSLQNIEHISLHSYML